MKTQWIDNAHIEWGKIRPVRFARLFWPAVLLFLTACAGESGPSTVFEDLPFKVGESTGGEVVTVNGYPVTEEEIQLAALGNHSRVLTFFRERFGGGSEPDFWTHSFEGRFPLDRLRRFTLISCSEAKITQMLAKQYNLREDISFEALRERWLDENRARREALDKGEELYGPPQYTLLEFYEQDLRSLALAVRQRLEEERLLETVDSDWIPHEPESRLERLMRTFRAYIERETAQADVQIDRQRFLQVDLVEPDLESP